MVCHNDSLIAGRHIFTSGDIIYFNVLGQHFMILSSLEITTDLFEKRSANYSDRTQPTMMIELCVSDSFHLKKKKQLKICGHCSMNWDLNFAMLRYNLWWRKHRRSFHQYFHRDAAIKYQPIQQRGTKAFLRRLLVTPDDFFYHIRQ